MDADELLRDWAELTGRAGRPGRAPRDRRVRLAGLVARLAGGAVMVAAIVATLAWVAPGDRGRQVGGVAGSYASPASCPVTGANGTPWPATGTVEGTYGSGGLIVRLPANGSIRVADAQVDASGVLWEKIGVWRDEAAAGTLTLAGRRLDGPSDPMLAHIPDGYGATGLQIASIGFPVEGCWEITATAGAGRLVLVTRVVHTRAGDPTEPPITLADCPVSAPNGAHTSAWPASELDHGHHGLYTVLWPDGNVLVEPSQVDADGVLWMKFVFQRESGALASLAVTGQRLDTTDPTAADATLRAVIPDGDGTSGIQATSLGFPSPGCWEVLAKAGPAMLSFVIRVELAPLDPRSLIGRSAPPDIHFGQLDTEGLAERMATIDPGARD